MMKPVVSKGLLLIATTLFVSNAFAYADDKKKELCRQPKIQEFSLPVYSESNKKEAQPEQEFTFVVSGWANPKKFKLMGKSKNIPFTVQSTETYHKVKAKLLPEYSGQTVLISARIPAVLECYSTISWLVKVSVKTAGATTPAAATPAPVAGNNGAAKAVQPSAAATPTAQPAPAAKPVAETPKMQTPEEKTAE